MFYLHVAEFLVNSNFNYRYDRIKKDRNKIQLLQFLHFKNVSIFCKQIVTII